MEKAGFYDFVECSCSVSQNRLQDYGVYIYLYNPAQLEIDVNSRQNSIEMAVEWKEEHGYIFGSNYEKFGLEFISSISEGIYKNLFYKFKIIDHEVNGKSMIDRIDPEERRYDISSVELLTKGYTNAVDYHIGKQLTYTGYAKGCGEEADGESTLQCNKETLDTVSLDVNSTYYRTKTSDKGKGWQHQINSVYFSVPNRYFENYGTLQRIKAEWYEYVTKDIVVTSFDEFYEQAKDWVGKLLPEIKYVGIGNKLYATDEFKGGIYDDYQENPNYYSWAWNPNRSMYLSKDEKSISIPSLYFLFLCENIEKYDPYGELTTGTGGVLSNTLQDYILNYDKSYHTGKLPIKNGNISADLFEDDIDEDRKKDNPAGVIKQGYSYYDFDASLDIEHLGTWEDTDPSFWDNWKEWGLLNAIRGDIPEEEGFDVAPIKILTEQDIYGTDAEICDRLKVNIRDVADIQKAVQKGQITGEQVVLFRFANTDYYSNACTIEVKDDGKFPQNDEAYRAKQTVFFDFDIIQLSFHNDDGAWRIIPVVSNPIDIIPDITPPVDMPEDWWKIIKKILTIVAMIFAVLIIIILISFLSPFLMPLLRPVGQVIAAPFRMIGNGITKLTKGEKKGNKGKVTKSGGKIVPDEDAKKKARSRLKKE